MSSLFLTPPEPTTATDLTSETESLRVKVWIFDILLFSASPPLGPFSELFFLAYWLMWGMSDVNNLSIKLQYIVQVYLLNTWQSSEFCASSCSGFIMGPAWSCIIRLIDLVCIYIFITHRKFFTSSEVFNVSLSNTLLIPSVEKLKHSHPPLLSSHVNCPSPRVEPMAGAVQGRSGADFWVPPVISASGQVSDRAIQRQPAGRSTGGRRRLQAGQQSIHPVSLQGTGPGQQHNTVSTLHLMHQL